VAGPLDRLEHLIGTWEGRETGAAGTGIAKRTYTRLFDRYVEARHRSVSEPQDANPTGETHEELIVFSADGSDLVAREFHSDGMVISFALADSSDDTLAFHMTGIENGPPGIVARLTLTMRGLDRLTEVLELGPDVDSMAEFIRVEWERSDGRPEP
jgi:hypothetical protein